MSETFDATDRSPATREPAPDVVSSPEVARPALNADQRSSVPRVELTAIECRVLGALIEKEFLTPDIYPMTTNALVSACNQKTNREPVVDYGAVTVDGALLALRQRQLVRRVHMPGSRSTKHRQALGEVLALDAAELAVLSVLMLRGAQTVGELRLRTERQHGFEDLAATDACLEGLASRPIPLVEQLERQPGHKEARWQHLLADPAASEPVANRADDRHRSVGNDLADPAPAPGAAAEPREAVRATGDLLAERVAALEAEVEMLRTQLRRLAGQLGESLD